MNLRRYIAMGGKMGVCPDWYGVITAARYLGVPPWELIEQSIYWQDRAFVAMTAEKQAQEVRQKIGK
jgi:hypothetical protein